MISDDDERWVFYSTLVLHSSDDLDCMVEAFALQRNRILVDTLLYFLLYSYFLPIEHTVVPAQVSLYEHECTS